MVRAARKMAEDIKRGKLLPEAVDEACFNSYLDTWEVPDPDLLIRTSGEQRLSNFMLWQLAYTEFYFTDTLWPDFDRKALVEAIRQYNSREMCIRDRDKSAMIKEIEDVEGVKWALGMDSIVGTAVPDSMIPDDVKSMLKSDNYELEFICSDYKTATPEVLSLIHI